MKNMPMDTDVYFHKTITFRAWKRSLLFRTSQELFSSHDIDAGTKFLLRTMVEGGYGGFQRILDMGCGYGPLGLMLNSLYPHSAVHLVDRDALAVEYSRQNAALNGLDGVEIYGSSGYDDVKRKDFDLIVSNIPGKAGESVITYLLQEARYFLKPGGTVAVVVVSPLEELVTKTLTDLPGAEIILKRARSGHTVFHYRFSDENPLPPPAQSALERGVYHRGKITVRLNQLEYTMQTAYGLPEFDSLSYGSEMLVKALLNLKGRKFRRAVMLNPGQGHIPVALWKLFQPRNIVLVDCDLLALRYSLLNLTVNGCPPEYVSSFHKIGADLDATEKSDLVLGVLRDEGQKANLLTLDGASAQLASDGLIILAAGSTAVTRLVAYTESQNILRIRSRERWRGFSVLVLEKLDSRPAKR
jgi:16S rRNA (guanine1207-N2)-methyltransferase